MIWCGFLWELIDNALIQISSLLSDLSILPPSLPGIYRAVNSSQKFGGQKKRNAPFFDYMDIYMKLHGERDSLYLHKSMQYPEYIVLVIDLSLGLHMIKGDIPLHD